MRYPGSLTIGSTLVVSGVIALATLAGEAKAQTFPTRPVRLVVALAPGGPTDTVSRIYAAKLSELLGQQVLVDNRPGAGGSVAGEIVSRAPADGHTLFSAANGTIAIAPNLLLKLPYSVSRDLTPVALIGNSPFAVMVHPAVPAKSMKDLLAIAKAHPGKINFGSAGQGSTSQLSTELLKMLTGVNMTHVPYKGAGPALIGAVAGEIDLMISGVSTGLPFIKQGKLRGLAVTSRQRIKVLPELPPVADTVPGYEASSWYAVMAPAATPRAVIDKLNRESIAVIQSPEINAKLTSQGVEPEALSPEQLGEKIRTETARWGKVVKAAGVKPQ
ncbi:MAG: tripartite tricarboxylate transporter substrate binding protein [Betaproteobacteria bacterium]|nr:MAG: tripartite tricarboxylate transporter substrate binding protein [Betaproteobacteria bacterium]